MNREQGYSTYKREKILEYLKEKCDMTVTIGDISAHLETQQVEVNVSTIYRYLERLEKQGLLLKTVNGRKEQAAFQYIGDRNECHNHLHMKCQSCGMVFHLDCDFMEEISAHILQQHGFYINCQDSCLTGLCSVCRGLSGVQAVESEESGSAKDRVCGCGCKEKIHHE